MILNSGLELNTFCSPTIILYHCIILWPIQYLYYIHAEKNDIILCMSRWWIEVSWWYECSVKSGANLLNSIFLFSLEIVMFYHDVDKITILVSTILLSFILNLNFIILFEFFVYLTAKHLTWYQNYFVMFLFHNSWYLLFSYFVISWQSKFILLSCQINT